MRPMMPMVVAVFGSGRRALKISRTLETKLRRRGLHVHRLKKENGLIVADPDVILLHLPDGDGGPVADWIERLWSRRWVRWYKEARHAHI